jgi:hypothetical protein
VCDCSDFEAPAVYEDVVRRARKRHRCGECRGLIEPGHHYWESRGLWDGQWSTYRTCGSCSVVGRNLVDCYSFCALAECIEEELDLSDRTLGRDARIAYAGMRRRRRHAERTLRREAAHEAHPYRR